MSIFMQLWVKKAFEMISIFFFCQRRQSNRYMKRSSTSLITGINAKPQWDTISYLSEWLLSKGNKCWQACRQKELSCTIGGNVNWGRQLLKIKWVPQNLKNRTTMWSSTIVSGYTYRRRENRILERCLQFHVHWSIMHNSQDMETT